MKKHTNKTRKQNEEINDTATVMQDEAIELIKAGHIPEGVVTLQRLVRRVPNNAIIHYNLGSGLVMMGEFDQGIDHLQQAHSLDPTLPMLEVMIAVALIAKNELMAARRILEGVIALEPKNHYALSTLGRCLLEMHQSFDIAENCFRRAIAIHTNDQKAWLGLGMALQRMNRTEDAIKAYEQAIAIDPYSGISVTIRPMVNDNYSLPPATIIICQ